MALAEEVVYYCNLAEAQYISSTENKNEKLDHAFFLKVNEYTKEMEFSENFVSLEFNDAEVFDHIFRESPFFIAPFKIQELELVPHKTFNKGLDIKSFIKRPNLINSTLQLHTSHISTVKNSLGQVCII